MFTDLSKITQNAINIAIVFMLVIGVSACDSEPPTLMKAVKQFESDAVRDEHVKYMRKNHKDALIHKRDETMIRGIRTEENSLNACINCHIPEKHNGKVLRHTDPEHFCSTCHTYVGQALDCFQCHVDHPVSDASTTSASTIESLDNNAHGSSFKLESASLLEDHIAINEDVTGESSSE